MSDRLFSIMLTAIILLAIAGDARALDRYTVKFTAGGKQVDVRGCFAGQAPKVLYRSEQAASYASPLSHSGTALKTRGSDELRLPELPQDACLDWSVDLGAAAAKQEYRTAFTAQDSILAATGLWFWKGPWQRDIEVTVELPEGVSISVPWTPIPGKPLVYRPTRTPASWTTRSAVGRFTSETLDVPGGKIELALLGPMSTAQQRKMITWIETTAAALTPVFGFFPREHLQVVVVAIGPRSEAVPWAHVVRGGGPSIQFYVDETRPLSEFQGDWTATHEFSHLLLPYVSRNDRWLSEGMASYYQNVLRARDGRLSEQAAWQKLHDGFERGEKATKGDTLREATRSGWGSTMRVYWSGAAMMLEADTRLRALTDGEQSLDSALRALHGCCMEPGKRWRARDVFRQLDQLTGTTVFSEIYREEALAKRFPDVSDTYRELGLSTRRGKISMQDAAPLAGIRREIMSGESGGIRANSSADNAP